MVSNAMAISKRIFTSHLHWITKVRKFPKVISSVIELGMTRALFRSQAFKRVNNEKVFSKN